MKKNPHFFHKVINTNALRKRFYFAVQRSFLIYKNSIYKILETKHNFELKIKIFCKCSCFTVRKDHADNLKNHGNN